MKTISRITILILTALLISLNVLATGFELETEQYIDDIPFNLNEIEAQTKLDSALLIDYTLNEEEYIDDIPFSEQQLESVRLYTEAMNQTFDFEEENYIDDIPCNIERIIDVSHECLYAKKQ